MDRDRKFGMASVARALVECSGNRRLEKRLVLWELHASWL